MQRIFYFLNLNLRLLLMI